MFPQIRPGTPIEEFYRQLLQGCPILDGKVMTCVFTAGGSADQVFPHGLGRQWRGAWLMGISTPATIAARVGSPESSTSTADLVPVSINTPANVTISVWVY